MSEYISGFQKIRPSFDVDTTYVIQERLDGTMDKVDNFIREGTLDEEDRLNFM